MRDAVSIIERFFHRHGRKLGTATLVASVVFLWLPILTVVIMSFSPSRALSFPPDGLSLQWYGEFMSNSTAKDSIVSSVLISVAATPLSVLLGLMFAYGITRFSFKGKGITTLFITLPIVVPMIVVGLAMSLFFGIIGFGGGNTAIVAAHIVRTLPFTALILIPTLLAFDQTYEEAAMDLGADEIKTFTHITLPNILPGILAATFLTFAISFNEFIYTYFVRDVGTQTLPIYLWGQIRHGVTPEVNVISFLFLVLAVSLVLLAAALTHVERIALRSE